MKKRTVISLIVATSLILAGIIIFAGAMTMLNWNFKNLSTTKYETNDYEINEAFTDIIISVDTADIKLIPYHGDKCKVVCFEDENFPHTVKVDGSALIISEKSSKKWYHHIGFNFNTPKVSVYLPSNEYGALTVSASTGDIEIPKDFRFASIEISASTGDVDVEASASDEIKIKVSTGDIKLNGVFADKIDVKTTTGHITLGRVECVQDLTVRVTTGKSELDSVKCKSLFSVGTTGDISLDGVIAEQMLSIKRSTGDVSFEDADAGEIFVETSTGSVTGTLLSEKIFTAQSDTGRVRVPSSTNGGRCEITTDTGRIDIKVR